MHPDERTIREAHTTWIDAVNARDLEKLFRMMTDDVVFLHPGHKAFGRDVFAATFSGAHEQARIHCSSELIELVLVGEVAYSRCSDTVIVTPHAGGESLQFAGDRLTIYRRQPDGRWLLARDANVLTPVENGNRQA
jgi:uncharacterized protein (TIGR02246 family)